MVSYVEYLKKILTQTIESYQNLKEIQDKPGDLDYIKKEMLKINGFLKVLTNNVDEYKIPLSDFKNLKVKLNHYLENYSFENEIETMAPLYSDDVYRIKNMRFKIIEALEDKKMIESIEDLIEQLWLKRKNVFFVDAVIIKFLDVIATWQKIVVATIILINIKEPIFV